MKNATKLLALVLALLMLVPMLFACGGGEDETEGAGAGTAGTGTGQISDDSIMNCLCAFFHLDHAFGDGVFTNLDTAAIEDIQNI